MRYKPLNKTFFVDNRKRLAAFLPKNSLAVFNSNDVMPTNADGVLAFVQNSDLYYLCGIDQEETMLVLQKDGRGKLTETLFITETSELIAIWEGQKLTQQEAAQLSGINQVFWLQALPAYLEKALKNKEVFLNSNEHARSVSQVESRDARFAKWLKKTYAVKKYKRLAPLLTNMRVIKQPPEIAMLKTAAKIGGQAFNEVARFVKPGRHEFEIEAVMTAALLSNRSRRHAFLPIIACGASACVLHYVENNRALQKGSLLLMDFGAEYGNYHSDISRTIPVSGQFTQRQRQVYNAVLGIHDFAITKLKAGNTFADYRNQVKAFAEREMARIGGGGVMPHGVSHFLGLDVHDVGTMTGPMQAGMVLTCEPGIYIKAEGLGIRLESDILITAQGNLNLTKHIPIKANEIEELMQNGKLNKLKIEN